IFTTLKTFYGIVIPDKDHRIAKYQSARRRSLSRNGTDRVFLYFLNTQVKVKMSQASDREEHHYSDA
ncbi:MAG: hypothetical protein AABZ40_04235, partial [Thermodesulfobacteriota bacterium]